MLSTFDVDDGSKENLLSAVRQLEVLDMITLREQSLRLQEQNLDQRALYANCLLFMLIGQAIVINVFFLFMGLGKLSISDNVFETFAVSVFVEIVALPLIVTKSLFPTKESSPFEGLVKAIKSRITGTAESE